MRASWAFSFGGRAPEEVEGILEYLRGVVEALQQRFDIEVEWATMSGVDLLRGRERQE
jgi:hypothetical protein